MKLRLIELFAGYGSQAMALKRINADFESWRVVEFDKYAIRSYNAVHGTNYEPMDITKIHAEDLGICDTDQYLYMMTYSFPCTDLSLAGKRAGMEKGSGTRSGLLWEVERLLREIVDAGCELPHILFMENVPQVHGEKNKKSFGDWTLFLNSLGYFNYMQDLNAADYGVAQHRVRTFMFSFLDRMGYEFPEPVPLEKCLDDYLDTERKQWHEGGKNAERLIQELINNGTLPSEPPETEGRIVVNSNFGRAARAEIAGTILTKSEATGRNGNRVIEW